jgi:hypothetical protein
MDAYRVGMNLDKKTYKDFKKIAAMLEKAVNAMFNEYMAKTIKEFKEGKK